MKLSERDMDKAEAMTNDALQDRIGTHKRNMLYAMRALPRADLVSLVAHGLDCRADLRLGDLQQIEAVLGQIRIDLIYQDRGTNAPENNT